MSASEQPIVHREVAVIHQPRFGLHSHGVGLEVWLQWANHGGLRWFSTEDAERFLIAANIRDVAELEGRPVVAETKDGCVILTPYVPPILR